MCLPPQTSACASLSLPPRSMSVITFDLEIAVPVEEVSGGWEAVRRGDAGVSCLCLYDTSSSRYHVYDEHDLEEGMAHLNEADLLVGFNSISFDTPIMESITGYTVNPIQYDILAEVWRALPSRQKGYRLAEICDRLALGTKVQTGESAPNLYRSGRMGKLIDYCIQDVHLTRKLANWINTNGYIMTPEYEPLEVSRIEVEV